ncbi:MAG TPA: aldehyde dehydrogenase family protein [Gammaproteobacteria bacterium]|nr:aldehyde dehydrogenase family protein [Gammaproteobacteria bacterium]
MNKSQASDTASSYTLTRNPANGEVIARTRELTAEEVREAIRRARAAQPAWAALLLRDRARHVAAMRRALLDDMDDIASLISRCVGKTRLEALATEVMPTVTGSRWYERHARAELKPRRLATGSLLFFNKKSTVHRLPHGVVGIISPWNYPLGIPMHEIVPALLAGNTVLFKTSPETLPVGEWIAELWSRAQLPPGVFQHLNMDGPLCGDLFLEDAGVDKLFFTGSVRVGKQLMAKAAATLKPLSLELGGKDAMIVCADADLERAAGGAVWAGLSNAGQSCAGVERLYVHQDIYGPFMALLKEKVEALRMGTHLDVGALCTDRQVETVRQHYTEALAAGATVFARSKAPPGMNDHFIPPTVLTDVDHSMRVMREETFGPILGVMQVADDAEALRLANDSPYGLSGSVWTRDLRKGERLARRLSAGAVMVNDHLLSHGLTETPWGGFRDSGIGRGHGAYAFEEVTVPQVVVEDWLTLARRNIFWHPYGEDVYQGLKGVMTALYGHEWRARTAGAWRFIRLLPRMFRRRTPTTAPAAAPPSSEPPSERQQLAQFERWGEEAYSRMYDARSPSGDYSEAKENFHSAISLASKLGLTDEATRLEKRLEHIKNVFRSQS